MTNSDFYFLKPKNVKMSKIKKNCKVQMHLMWCFLTLVLYTMRQKWSQITFHIFHWVA